MDKVIVIADDFTDAPGARLINEGDDSGEKFYQTILEPEFKTVLDSNNVLTVDLDGTYGYASSFISESFGRLSKKYGVELVLKHIKLKSDEDEAIKDYVIKTIQNPDDVI